MIERLGVVFGLGFGTQGGFQNRLKDLPRQRRAPLRQGAIANLLAREHADIIGQVARALQDMPDQAHDQFDGSNFGWATASGPTVTEEAADKCRGHQTTIEAPKDRVRERCFVSHPQLNGVLAAKVQA